MFYELLKESVITFILAMGIGVVFTLTVKGLPSALYFFAGSLTYLLIFGGMVTWRALTYFGTGNEENET